MELLDRITMDPLRRTGKPTIRGMRITVQDVLSYLATGMTYEELLDDFSDLERDDILACLAWASLVERRTVISA